MERGYIKIYRKLLDSGIIQNPTALQLFCYLLLTAAYKPVSRDVRGEMIKLEPGQCVFGRKTVAEKLKIGEQSIRTALKYLEKNEILTIRTTKRYSLITIINWNTYQDKNDSGNHQTNHELTMSQPSGNHELTMSQPSGNHELTTVKEFKHLSIKEFKNLRSEEGKKLSIEESLLPDKSGEKETQKSIDEKFFNFARRFQNEVRINLGNTSPPVTEKLIQNGAAELEKAVRLDCFDWEELTCALVWATQDTFWRQNLRSLATLRQKTRNGITKAQEIVGRYRAERDSSKKIRQGGNERAFIDKTEYVMEQNRLTAQRWLERELKKHEDQKGERDE